MPEVILDEFQRAAGIEEMGCDSVPQGMAGVPIGQTSRVPIAGEERLDLALPKRATAPWEEGAVFMAGVQGQVPIKWIPDRGEKRPLRPVTVLQTADDDSGSVEVYVAPAKERDLADAKPVEVAEQEDEAITLSRDRVEEAANFLLGKILRWCAG